MATPDEFAMRDLVGTTPVAVAENPAMTANTEHEVVKLCQPSDGGIKIWRYMDLPKLVAFLETESLHFARADTLGDPFEGSWTRLNRAAQETTDSRNDRRCGNEHPRCKSEVHAEKLQQEFERSTHFARQTTYVNCWHGGETESAAMWKLYGTATGSIVIQSTYKKLVDALQDDVYMGDVCVGSVYMGMVQYKDYISFEDWIPGGNVMDPFIHKRREFEHEKEVRAFLWTPEGFSKQRREKGGYKPRGVKVDIDIKKVVETIRVQPTTPAWARQAIEKLLRRYGWGIKVIPSKIDIEPIY